MKIEDRHSENTLDTGEMLVDYEKYYTYISYKCGIKTINRKR